MPRRSTGSFDAPLSFPPTRCQVPVRSTWATTGTAADSTTAVISAAMPGFSYFMCHHLAEQGVGSHLLPLGSFLKTGAVSLALDRYRGSSTCVVIVSHSSPFGRL